MAETTGQIGETFMHQMSVKGRPGFQVGPDVPVEECVDILEEQMRSVFGVTDFEFNASFGNIRPTDISRETYPVLNGGSDASGRHTDEPEARRKAGIALHVNVQGVGHTILQAARPGVIDFVESKRRSIKNFRQTAGPQYQGELVPGMMTVMSEGLVASAGLIAVTLGPAIHEFTTTGPDPRQWYRLTWVPTGQYKKV